MVSSMVLYSVSEPVTAVWKEVVEAGKLVDLGEFVRL